MRIRVLGVLGASAIIACSAAAATSPSGSRPATGSLSPGPLPSSASATATAISAGAFHSCALASAGGVVCWGYNEGFVPSAVSGLASGVAAIAAGGYHTCALTSASGVVCWGWNDHGQLGNGQQGCGDVYCSTPIPVAVSGLASGVAAISAGGAHSCALTSAGAVRCWGGNGSGQLGDGTSTQHLTPVDVSGLGSGVAAIAAGGLHTCALTSAGGVKCWGGNKSGQLGDGTTIVSPTPVGVIGFGGSLTCAVPDVLGKRLATAKAKITRAHCQVGMVRRVSSPKKKNIVVGQRPRPGKRLKKGAKVNLKISRGPLEPRR
jgi:alpha-tubulin suppressor-like RCC1 family protein